MGKLSGKSSHFRDSRYQIANATVTRKRLLVEIFFILYASSLMPLFFWLETTFSMSVASPLFASIKACT